MLACTEQSRESRNRKLIESLLTVPVVILRGRHSARMIERAGAWGDVFFASESLIFHFLH